MDSITRCCWHITKCSQKFWNERCLPFGIGIGQVPLLSLLYRKEGLSQEEISRYLSIDKAATAKSVAKLLELGLIGRESDPEDARLRRIKLTPQGRALKEPLAALETEWDRVLTRDFGETEIELLAQALARIRTNAVSASQG
jgi:DNA-binding MarR family transcriptional regulator